MIEDSSSMDRPVERGGSLKLRISILLMLALVIASAIAFLYPSLGRWAAAEHSVDRSRLRLGQITRGELLRDVSVQGRIIAAYHPTILSPTQGTVSILMRAGDVVRENQVMARVESPELQNELKQERSTLQSMESELERQKIAARQAHLENLQEVALLEVQLAADQRAMERARALLSEGLGNEIDYEGAQDDVKVRTIELAHARANIQLEQETLDFEIRNRSLQVQRQQLVVQETERRIRELNVVSPVSGLVSRVEVKDKDTVQANQILFSVVDLSQFQVEVAIPENYAGEIGPGTLAVVQYDGSEHSGEVRLLSPEVEDSQVRGIVAFTDPMPAGLKQNQRVSTRLILDSRPNVLKVPRGPFLESMAGRQVYVVEAGMARLRPIRVGAISVTEVEIVSGVSEGEQVVLSDLSRFEGATRILIRD